MQALPSALAGLSAYPQFILYRLQRVGVKLVKKPIDWRTGRMAEKGSGAHLNPDMHTTADLAFAMVAAGRGDGVGFVFTDADPFFFLDIDHALTPTGDWSATAQDLCARFAGAAVEVSASGHGLHIIGTGTPPAHSCDNDDEQLQFYTRARFVALTGTHAQGDVRFDCNATLPWLVTTYFPPRVANAFVWREGPREDWRGPTEDEDLLRRALRAQGARAAFGTGATFADLWTGNVDALARTYPSETDAYNRSRADAALASHLAFWTGCDGPRIERLMRQSALVRDKWDDRPDYLAERTIGRMIALQRDVCRDKPVDLPPAAPPAPIETPKAEKRSGSVFLSPTDQETLFAGCVYVRDRHVIQLPNGDALKDKQFRAHFGGYTFLMDEGNEKTTRSAWEAFTESSARRFPRASSSWFRPDLPPGSIVEHEGRTFVNSYVDLQIPRTPGDPSRFLAHLARLLPDERDRTIVLSYMAACVQHPGVKFQWAPLIQGVEGNGKSLLSRCVAYAVGERYTHWPRPDQVSNRFNSWLVGKIFVGMEDVYLPDDHGEVFEILKPMITNDRQPVEPKGVDQYSAYVWANFLLNMNRRDGLRKTRNDRRIAPFHCAQQSVEDLRRDGMRNDYFPSLYRWLKSEGGYAVVAHYLATFPIPDEFNPAGACDRAPITTATEAAISDSLGAIEQEVLEAIASGQPGFCGGWISSRMLDVLLTRVNRARAMSHRRREKMLGDLGYIRHPHLTDGRVNNPVAPDASKPILYVKPDSDQARIESPAEVARAYSDAQTPG